MYSFSCGACRRKAFTTSWLVALQWRSMATFVATQDLDLWIKEDENNIKKFKSVLKHHGGHGIDQTCTLIFITSFTQLNIGDSGFVIDPMYHLKVFRSYDFDQCFERAQEGEYKGVKVPSNSSQRSPEREGIHEQTK